MILARRQFAAHFNMVKSGLGKWDSPVWIPEEIAKPKADRVRGQWFVCVRPITVNWDKDQYWSWCKKNLSGKVLCYSSSGNDSDVQEEWWGFTDKKDIVLWTLRWT